MLVGLSSSIALSDLVRDIKQGSSKWAKQQDYFPNFRGWGKEYGAFSCSIRDKDAIINYINNQRVHHRQKSFEQEYQDMLGEGSFLLDGAIMLLAAAKRTGHKCYIVTNGVAKTQHRRLEASGIKRYADRVFISEELGCAKPSHEFFDKVFAVIGEQNRKDALIIGDSLSSDIKGGNNAGITACWMNPNHMTNETDAVADYEIVHLDELYAILGIQ